MWRPTHPEDADLTALATPIPFAALDSARLAALRRAAGVRNVTSRVELVVEGTPADSLYVVLDGCVELYAQANGREATTVAVRTGGSFPTPGQTAARGAPPHRPAKPPGGHPSPRGVRR